jgi:hypothetical protein
VLENTNIREIQTIPIEGGVYKFAADKLTARLLVCQSNKDGYTLYESQDKEEFKVYRNKEINRREYGEPANVMLLL